MKLLTEYIERSALGIEIWRYPAHNPRAKARAEEAAANRGAPGRSTLLVPVPEGEQADMYGIDIVEPGLGGVNELKDVMKTLYMDRIKRYILGQTLSSEAEATGMGSGVADAHMATFADIVSWDAQNLAETLTYEFLRVIQLLNFPKSHGVMLKFKFNTESSDVEGKLSGFERAYQMGADIKVEDIYSVLGSSRPSESDEVLNIKDQSNEMPMGGDNVGPMGVMNESNQEFSKPAETFQANTERYREQLRLNDVPGKYSAITTLRSMDVADPTEAQAKAGNYKKGHVRIHGMPITVETKKGGTRRGKDWERTMTCHYGYIGNTKAADGDHLDVFIGEQPHSEIIFVIDQIDKNGDYDEAKCILGTTNRKQARKLYLSNYPKGWKVGPMTSLTVDQFREWLKDGKHKKPISPQVSRYSAELNE